MSKRPADDQDGGKTALKDGGRPAKQEGIEDLVGDFEDDFEDEYESEDEILEAGVDGRPDAEREAEEKAGEYRRMQFTFRCTLLIANPMQKQWM